MQIMCDWSLCICCNKAANVSRGIYICLYLHYLGTIQLSLWLLNFLFISKDLHPLKFSYYLQKSYYQSSSQAPLLVPKSEVIKQIKTQLLYPVDSTHLVYAGPF